jgi:hypothetical protein
LLADAHGDCTSKSDTNPDRYSNSYTSNNADANSYGYSYT